jgi:hypothetical protein
MAEVRFICNAVDVFDLSALMERARSEYYTGDQAERTVRIEVRHPDREMDGSCRWCGCRTDEVIEFAIE